MSSVPGWAGGGYGGATTQNKITKAKGRIVKPILKKLSNSEKNSLDLDRDWQDQQQNWGGSRLAWPELDPGSGAAGAAAAANRSARDVSFASARFADAGGAGAAGGGVGNGGGSSLFNEGKSSSSSLGGRPQFQHGRSASGASHVSVATSASGGVGPGSSRAGTFVHPFQQTPRTATPPISYANSLASLDSGNSVSATPIGGPRDSPTITENEDDDDYERGYSLHHNSHSRPPIHSHSRSGSSSSHHHNHHPYSNQHGSYSLSQSSLRRPSLASHRTGSYSELHSSSSAAAAGTSASAQSTLGGGNNSTSSFSGGAAGRISTSRPGTQANSSTRLYHGGSNLSSSKSHSDLRLNLTLNTTNDSRTSVGRNNRSGSTTPMTIYNLPPTIGSPGSAFYTAPAPMSPLRGSLDIVGGALAPRLRSLSENQQETGRSSFSSTRPSRTATTMNPAEHAKMVREARAKFEEKERARDEKFERRQAEKQQKQAMKEYARSMRSAGGTGTGASSLDLPRLSTSTSASHDWLRRYGSAAPLTTVGSPPLNEKMIGSPHAPELFASRSYDALGRAGEEPAMMSMTGGGSASDPGANNNPRRATASGRGGKGGGGTSAKRKTHGYWTSLVLWIRTKIFKLSRGD